MHNELLDGFLLLDSRVEPLTGQVTRGDSSVHLPPKAIEVLLFLAKSPRTLVSRADILGKVWGDENASQVSLNHAISEIRHALGDDLSNPTFLQTVPRRGYRLLVEPVLLSARPEAKTEPRAAIDDDPNFWNELFNRGVVQAGVAYLVVGWVLIQVAEVTFERIGLPTSMATLVIFAVIGGFPIVLVLAWFLEFAEGKITLDRGGRSRSLFATLDRNYVAIVAAYAFAFTGAAVYEVTIGFPPPRPDVERAEIIPIEPNSLAVLWFLNIDGSERTQIFSDGLSEDVLDRLAAVPGLRVSSRGDSWSLPAHPTSSQIRDRLRVAYYLEGSVRLVGDELRVVVQLIRSDDGTHVVSRGFEKVLDNFMEVQKEITSLAVANLRVALPPETQAEIVSTQDITDVDAYILYRRGKYLLDEPDTLATLQRAAEYFTAALDIDGRYAAAHAGLCMVGVQRYEFTNSAQDIRSAEDACATALSASPQLSMVHTALGALYRRTGRLAEARSAYESALEANEKDASALIGLAGVLARENRVTEADRYYRRAIDLQPGNWNTINQFGNFLFARGRFNDAAEQYRKVVFLDPDNWVTLGNLGSALMMSGDFRNAQSALNSSLEIETNQTFLSNLGIIHYYLGDFERSVEIHQQVVAQSPRSNFSWLNLADALYFSGRVQQADDAYSECVTLSRETLSVNAQDAESLYALAWALAMSGSLAEAREYLDRSIELSPTDYYVHYYDALIKAKSGEDDAALDALENAINLGYPVKMILSEPHLEGLRQHPEFIDHLPT